MMEKQIKQFFQDIGVDIKDQDIESFSAIYEKLVEAKSSLKGEKQKRSFHKIVRNLSLVNEKEKSLFPNEIPDKHFGIPSIFSDIYATALSEIDDRKDSISSTIQSYRDYNREGDTHLQIDSKGQLSLKFDEQISEIKEDDEIDNIFDIVKKTIQCPVTLQHYCALWNYATKIQNSFRFTYVKIDDILATFLKKPSNGYFRQSTRENFTKSIKTLQKIKIRMPVKTSNKKTNKTEGNKFINIPLLNFELSTENKSGTVMLDLTGELLGSNYQNSRGRIFPEGIFELDSRNEGERISLAFKIATRLDQLNQKPIIWDRRKLVKYAGLENTDRANKNDGSSYLERSLKRLKEVGCIFDYKEKKITNDDNQKITIYSNINDDRFLQ